jgi:hypothetical protein
MRRFQPIRFLFLALLLSIIPAMPAHAGVFISVGIAPPPLPVYVQPPCPEPNMMWAPGYWAYDYDNGGYYWVPGAWVPAPYEGAMWTPPYWGWNDGFYAFHAGYWGPFVGYYGGVNYGFGYMGVGFAGGEWHEHHFFYNTAIVNVNRTYIHNTYINNTIVRDHTVVNYNHISYQGGPHGIQHNPTPEEHNAMQMQHVAPTRFQEQQVQEAHNNHQNFFNANHGRPQTVALSRPLATEHMQAPSQSPNQGDPRRGLPGTGGLSGSAPSAVNRTIEPMNGSQNRPQSNMQPNMRQNDNARITAAPANQQPQHGFSNVPQPVQRGVGNNVQQPQQDRTMQQQRSLNENQPNGNRPQSQQLYRPNMQQQPPQRTPQPQQQPRPQAQPRFDSQPRVQPIPSYRPAPQQQSRPQPQQQSRPQPQQQRAPEVHSAPQPRPESHPRH